MNTATNRPTITAMSMMPAADMLTSPRMTIPMITAMIMPVTPAAVTTTLQPHMTTPRVVAMITPMITVPAVGMTTRMIIATTTDMSMAVAVGMTMPRQPLWIFPPLVKHPTLAPFTAL